MATLMPNHREEALKALTTIEDMIARDEPMVGLRKRLALATLEHAKAEVAAIEELRKRRRRKATPEEGAPRG